MPDLFSARLNMQKWSLIWTDISWCFSVSLITVQLGNRPTSWHVACAHIFEDFITARNEVGARLCFTGVCDSVHGGSTWPGTPPWTRSTPLGPGTPPGTRYTPQTKYTPLGPGAPLGTRYTPWDQVHPQTRYTPWDQVLPHPWDQVLPHPLRPGTPQTRCNPLGPGTPPRTRYTPWNRYTPWPGNPPGPGNPLDQVPPWDQVHPWDHEQSWNTVLLTSTQAAI